MLAERPFVSLFLVHFDRFDHSYLPYLSAISVVMATTTNIETEAFVVDEPNAPFKLTPIILDEMRDDEYLIEMKYS